MNEGISIIADKYSSAMIQLGEQHEMLDTINKDLHLLKETVKSNGELREFIEHPLIKTDDKKDVLDKIFAEHISGLSLNMLKLLADNNRLFLLPFIADYYYKILCDMRNIDTAQVITAIPVDEATLDRVKEKLETLFNKQIKIEPHVDEQIIAGMIVKIKDKIIDGSIRTKFDNMKRQLIRS